MRDLLDLIERGQLMVEVTVTDVTKPKTVILGRSSGNNDQRIRPEVQAARFSQFLADSATLGEQISRTRKLWRKAAGVYYRRRKSSGAAPDSAQS